MTANQQTKNYCRICNDDTYGQSRGVQHYCGQCNHYTTKSKFSTKNRISKILLLDIETAPRESYEWKPSQEWTPPIMNIKEESILCYGAKWLFNPTVIGASVTGEEATNRTQESILQPVWELMDEAEIVVTQNGIDFDIKKLNSKFLLAGFPPPSKYLNVDVKVWGKKIFGFPYNSLDYYGKAVLGIEGKTKMEFEDWVGCVESSDEQESYLKKMLKYCKRDVAPLLEDIYLKFLPWIDGHPNLNIYNDSNSCQCRNCGSEKLSWTLTYPTPQGLWKGFRCLSCGAIGRGKGEGNRIHSSGAGAK
jgi:hypothetical protein